MSETFVIYQGGKFNKKTLTSGIVTYSGSSINSFSNSGIVYINKENVMDSLAIPENNDLHCIRATSDGLEFAKCSPGIKNLINTNYQPLNFTNPSVIYSTSESTWEQIALPTSEGNYVLTRQGSIFRFKSYEVNVTSLGINSNVNGLVYNDGKTLQQLNFPDTTGNYIVSYDSDSKSIGLQALGSATGNSTSPVYDKRAYTGFNSLKADISVLSVSNGISVTDSKNALNSSNETITVFNEKLLDLRISGNYYVPDIGPILDYNGSTPDVLKVYLVTAKNGTSVTSSYLIGETIISTGNQYIAWGVSSCLENIPAGNYYLGLQASYGPSLRYEQIGDITLDVIQFNA